MDKVEMRQVLFNELKSMMSEDERIVVIDADLAKANGTLPLREAFPERAFDVGIQEQNMAAMAAGMASCGFIPFIFSFCPFVTRRICDQIAISIAYAKQNVKIIGTDPGVTAEMNGGTHMSMEDIGVLRSIPNMVILEPADKFELKSAIAEMIRYDGPVYMRMSRKVVQDVYSGDCKFDLFKADIVKEGKDVSIFASGIMVKEALTACEILKNDGIDAEVINVHTIKPIDRETVIKSARKTRAAVTCENHNVVGGLKSAVSEVLIEECPVPLRAIGVKDHFGEVGTLKYLMEKFKMTSGDIVNAVKEVIELKK